MTHYVEVETVIRFRYRVENLSEEGATAAAEIERQTPVGSAIEAWLDRPCDEVISQDVQIQQKPDVWA